jgi:hypothetical protein
MTPMRRLTAIFALMLTTGITSLSAPRGSPLGSPRPAVDRIEARSGPLSLPAQHGAPRAKPAQLQRRPLFSLPVGGG